MVNVSFFPSSRRHTILQGDWSSDVCSSDLDRILAIDIDHTVAHMKLETRTRDRVITDHMNLVKVNGRWVVVNKIFENVPRSEERRVGKECRCRCYAWQRNNHQHKGVSRAGW